MGLAEIAAKHPAVRTRVRTVTPIGERVLVRPAKPFEKSKSGALVIPEIAKEAPQEGTIVATSDELEVRGSPLIEGLTVLYGKYAGHQIEVNDEILLMLDIRDVLGVITEEDSE